MNTLLNKYRPDSQSGFEQIESKEIRRENGESSTTAFMIAKESYGQISRKTNNSTEETRVNKSLIQTNKAIPRPPKEEINQLAKTWCELLLNQMQETHDKPLFIGAFDPNLEENKYRGFLINH